MAVRLCAQPRLTHGGCRAVETGQECRECRTDRCAVLRSRIFRTRSRRTMGGYGGSALDREPLAALSAIAWLPLPYASLHLCPCGHLLGPGGGAEGLLLCTNTMHRVADGIEVAFRSRCLTSPTRVSRWQTAPAEWVSSGRAFTREGRRASCRPLTPQRRQPTRTAVQSWPPPRLDRRGQVPPGQPPPAAFFCRCSVGQRREPGHDCGEPSGVDIDPVGVAAPGPERLDPDGVIPPLRRTTPHVATFRIAPASISRIRRWWYETGSIPNSNRQVFTCSPSRQGWVRPSTAGGTWDVSLLASASATRCGGGGGLVPAPPGLP